MAATQHVASWTASIRATADSCCHPPQAQTSWPAPAYLFLLTNAVRLRVFGAICRVSRVQTDHLLYSLKSFQEANWENNLKSARIYWEFSNLSCISQNASLKKNPVYREEKKKKSNVGKGKCEKREGEREVDEDKLSFRKYNCYSLFLSSFILSCGHVG